MNFLDIFGKKTEKDQFAALVLREFRRRKWPRALKYDTVNFSLSTGESSTIFLQNQFQSWKIAKPEAKNLAINDLVVSAFENLALEKEDKTFEAKRSRIWPTVRNRTYVENLWMFDGLNLGPAHYRGTNISFCEGFSIILTVNDTHNITICNHQTFVGWAKTFEEVLPIARQNLREQKRVWFDRHAEGFYFAETGDYFDSSLPLMTDAFSQLDLDGEPIALIPTRETLLVAGSGDITSLNAMCDIAIKLYEKDSRQVSLLPIVLKNGEWKPFVDASATYDRLSYLRQQNTILDYADQKVTLEEYFQQTGRDVFVAGVGAVSLEESKKTFLRATLLDGVPSLLPDVDILAVANATTEEIIIRYFKDVMSVMGPMPLEPNTYPRRYVFDGQLTDTQWEKLKIEFSLVEGFQDKLSKASPA